MALDYSNTKDTVYDIFHHDYSDEGSLLREMQRNMEICEGCRLCFKYCSTFPRIFDLIENTENNSIEAVAAKELDGPVSECFQCKLCYIKCPYTDRDAHQYDMNVPELFMRWKHVRKKTTFISPRVIRDYLLSRPVMTGKLAGLTAPLTNFFNRNGLVRMLMHLLIGIHHKKLLPSFRFNTFVKKFKKIEQISSDKQAVLFPTCYVNYNEPEIGLDAVSVLQKNGHQVACRSGECCGAPQLDLPNYKTARKWAWNVIQKHAEDVEAGRPVVAINPTCSMTMKKFYPRLFDDPVKKEAAERFSKSVYDFGEYLWKLKQDEKLNRDFRSTPGGTDYHAACHLRAQNIGFRSRDVMRLIPENTITFTDECSCHDGTFAFKKEYFDLSMKYGKSAFESMQSKPGPVKASDCPLAATQIQQGAGLNEKPLHPASILARAYREDGFEKKVNTDNE